METPKLPIKLFFVLEDWKSADTERKVRRVPVRNLGGREQLIKDGGTITNLHERQTGCSFSIIMK